MKIFFGKQLSVIVCVRFRHYYHYYYHYYHYYCYHLSMTRLKSYLKKCFVKVQNMIRKSYFSLVQSTNSMSYFSPHCRTMIRCSQNWYYLNLFDMNCLKMSFLYSKILKKPEAANNGLHHLFLNNLKIVDESIDGLTRYCRLPAYLFLASNKSEYNSVKCPTLYFVLLIDYSDLTSLLLVVKCLKSDFFANL